MCNVIKMLHTSHLDDSEGMSTAFVRLLKSWRFIFSLSPCNRVTRDTGFWYVLQQGRMKRQENGGNCTVPERRSLNSLPDSVNISKSIRTMWIGHVARVEDTSIAYRIFGWEARRQESTRKI
jgi:hypothetical protein